MGGDRTWSFPGFLGLEREAESKGCLYPMDLWLDWPRWTKRRPRLGSDPILRFTRECDELHKFSCISEESSVFVSAPNNKTILHQSPSEFGGAHVT